MPEGYKVGVNRKERCQSFFIFGLYDSIHKRLSTKHLPRLISIFCKTTTQNFHKKSVALLYTNYKHIKKETREETVPVTVTSKKKKSPNISNQRKAHITKTL